MGLSLWLVQDSRAEDNQGHLAEDRLAGQLGFLSVDPGIQVQLQSEEHKLAVVLPERMRHKDSVRLVMVDRQFRPITTGYPSVDPESGVIELGLPDDPNAVGGLLIADLAEPRRVYWRRLAQSYEESDRLLVSAGLRERDKIVLAQYPRGASLRITVLREGELPTHYDNNITGAFLLSNLDSQPEVLSIRSGMVFTLVSRQPPIANERYRLFVFIDGHELPLIFSFQPR